MSKAKDEIIESFEKYISAMKAQNKVPEYLYVTKAQWDTLAGPGGDKSFRPRYKGIEVKRNDR